MPSSLLYQFQAFTNEEAIRVLGLPLNHAEGFNEIDYFHFYRPGQSVYVSTRTLRLYRAEQDSAGWYEGSICWDA
jgi:hypothetical protein